jgi:restriction system protein
VARTARAQRQRRVRARRVRRFLRKKVHPLVWLVVAAGVGYGLFEAYRYTRRNPWQVGLSALAVAAVAGGVWYLVYRLREAQRRGRRLGNGIDAMTGPEFEQYVAGLMRRTGFRAVQVTGQAADLGADITAAAPDGRRVVVQCKRYAGSVGSPHVQRLNGTAWTIHRAEVTMLVTTGRLTGHAVDLAVRCGITVIDRPALATWISSNQPPSLPAPRRS